MDVINNLKIVCGELFFSMFLCVVHMKCNAQNSISIRIFIWHHNSIAFIFVSQYCLWLMFNLVVLNCVLRISSARWCIKLVNTLSISFFINDYWWWYNYSLQLAAIYHFEFHPKGCSIFGCSPGGERKFFWQPIILQIPPWATIKNGTTLSLFAS